MIRPRGPRTLQHLATRERPGEITIVLWFTGFLAMNSLAALAFAWLILGTRLEEAVTVVALHASMFLVFVAQFVGLLKGTSWGFWLSWATWGFISLGFALGSVLSLMNPEEKTFFGSLAGAITFGVVSLIGGTAFLLLVKARRRYFAPRPAP